MRPLALLIALAAAAAPARAQVAYFTPIPDSALTILTGETAQIDLEVDMSGGVSAYDITLFLDDARVTLVAADSVPGYGLPAPTITPGSGQVTISASGTGLTGYYMVLARLTFAMSAGAAEGSFVTMQVNSLTSGDGTTDVTGVIRTYVLRVCQAAELWGDADANRVLNSRDALIAITAAVGLPVGGYNVAIADVDGDGETTTRDALLILSEAVGLETYSRANQGKPNRCDPLAPMPADVAFYRSGLLHKVAAGDTLAVALPPLGDGNYTPSWAPDGSAVLVTRYLGSPSYDFIAVASDGSGADTLNTSVYGDYSAAWSPDGTRIAFVSTRVSPYSLYVMNADGTNQVRLTDTIWVEYYSQPEWSPDGSQIVFLGYNQSLCCQDALWVVNADGTGLHEVFAGSGGQSPYEPTWAPAGDSIAYDNNYWDRIFVVAATGDSIGQSAGQLQGGQNYPAWLPAGRLYQANLYPLYRYELVQQRASDGRYLQLTRGNIQPHRPAWRRTTRYVETISLAPTSAALSVSVSPTQQFAATVLDDLGGAITPGSGIQWTSSDTLVATVDQTGLVTAVGVGTATITASAGGWRLQTASVTVNP